jgi:hypothetical protein
MTLQKLETNQYRNDFEHTYIMFKVNIKKGPIK